MGRRYVVEFDDLCDATAPRLDDLARLKEATPDLRAVLFTIPKRTSTTTLAKAKAMGDWLYLAPHGWWHTRGECLGWTPSEATAKITAAREMGIDAPAFRAPAWLLDEDVYAACNELGLTVCDHRQYHLDILGSRVYRYNSTVHRAPKIVPIHGHLTNSAVDNWICAMQARGELDFAGHSEFLTPWEASIVIEVVPQEAVA